jgi:hypothetical protein
MNYTKKQTITYLQTIMEEEILQLNVKSKPLIYHLQEGKFKVGFNKKMNCFYYHLNGMPVEEWDTAAKILECMQGYLTNQSKATIQAFFKSRK